LHQKPRGKKKCHGGNPPQPTQKQAKTQPKDTSTPACVVPGVAEAAVLAVDATVFTAGDPVVPPRVSMARQEEPVSFCKWGGGREKRVQRDNTQGASWQCMMMPLMCRFHVKEISKHKIPRLQAAKAQPQPQPPTRTTQVQT
jgi:hypothetical protein